MRKTYLDPRFEAYAHYGHAGEPMRTERCLANPKANHEALRAMKAESDKRRAEDEARRAMRASLRRSGFTTAF